MCPQEIFADEIIGDGASAIWDLLMHIEYYYCYSDHSQVISVDSELLLMHQ